MNRTIHDLRDALQEYADHTQPPDPHATFAAVQDRVARDRRRRTTVLGAAACALLAAGGVAAGVTATRDQAPAPMPAHPSTVRPAPQQTARAVQDDQLPEFALGYRRLGVFRVPLGKDLETLVIPVHPAPGHDVAVFGYCPGVSIADFGAEWHDRTRVYLSAPRPQDRQLGPEQQGLSCQESSLLRRGGGLGYLGRSTGPLTASVKAGIGGVGHPPASLVMRLGVYESVPWQEFPFDRAPKLHGSLDPLPAAQRPPHLVVRKQPATADAANRPVSFTVPYAPDLTLDVELAGKGQLRVRIDGHDIVPSTARDHVHERDGWLLSWGADQGIETGLDTSMIGGPTPRVGAPVTVTIEPRYFDGPDWRAVLFHAPRGG